MNDKKTIRSAKRLFVLVLLALSPCVSTGCILTDLLGGLGGGAGGLGALLGGGAGGGANNVAGGPLARTAGNLPR